MQKSYNAKPADVVHNWWLVDLEDQILGRAATKIAHILRGKHKPTYTPHVDGGDFVVVINAEKVRLTGAKVADKTYYKHSGWIGNLKSTTAGEILESHPHRVLKKAVKGMLPHNSLGRAQLKKLKVYAGAEHPHSAQQPQPLDVKAKRAERDQ